MGAFLFVSPQDISHGDRDEGPRDEGPEPLSCRFLISVMTSSSLHFVSINLGLLVPKTSKVFLRWLLLPASCPQIACNHRVG